MAEPITVQAVFDRAIKLMDEQNDSGHALWSDTTEYQNRAIAIVNTLIGECYPSSDTYAVTAPGKRPVPQGVSTMEDTLCLDEGLAGTVLPYGLAAELMKNDDPALGNYFLQRYQELLARYAKALPAVWERIEDVYGVSSYTSYGRW